MLNGHLVAHGMAVSVLQGSTTTCAIDAIETLNVVRSQEAARHVGVKLAELCLEKGISKVSFDRGGHIYHGRVKVSLRHLFSDIVFRWHPLPLGEEGCSRATIIDHANPASG